MLRVIVTHMHPDHIGLAHWLTERFACRLWISATDWNVAQLACIATTGFDGDAAADLLPVLFHRKLDLHQTTFAMGEAIAHLHARLSQGRVRRVVGEDGVLRFSTIAGVS